MARRQLLTDEQWARLLAPPSDEREIVRYWTLSREDFDIIFRKRSDHSRLGFALLLCYLRYPGRVLGAEEVPPVALVSFVARQLGVSPAAFIRYSRRDQTRREQLAELRERLRVEDCSQETIRDISSLLQDPSPSQLVVAKGASKNGYDSCLHALASVDPKSTAADHIASSLASFAVIRHRLNQQQSIVEYTLESVRQPTKEIRHAA